MRPRRPILRYHGGKWKLAPWIISHFPNHRIYAEPYGGAASVLLRKHRSYAEVYNDLDGRIVNVFRVARDMPDQLMRAIELTPFSRDEFELSYEPSDDPVEWARRTIAMSFMGFGSVMAQNHVTGFRNDANRSGTTPARDWRNFPPALTGIIERLQGVTIENKPADYVISKFDSSQTLFYVDPPYVNDTRGTYAGKAYAFEMIDEDDESDEKAHIRLAKRLHNIDGMVILSGYDCEMYQDLYHDWHREKRSTFADGALSRTEILWIKPNARTQQSLFSMMELTA